MIQDGNPRWKGGKQSCSNGYIMVMAKDHPHTFTSGYVLEHRLVMEKRLGRYLTPQETIHHINGNKQDNRIENLVLCLSKAEHIRRYHGKGGL